MRERRRKGGRRGEQGRGAKMSRTARERKEEKEGGYNPHKDHLVDVFQNENCLRKEDDKAYGRNSYVRNANPYAEFVKAGAGSIKMVRE